MKSKRNSQLTEPIFYILLSLYDNIPKNGSQIKKYTMDITNKRIILKNGTLYPGLRRLEDKNLIIKIDNNLLEYRITNDGKSLLKQEMECLSEQLSIGKLILSSNKQNILESEL